MSFLPSFLGIVKSANNALNPNDAKRMAAIDLLAEQAIQGNRQSWVALLCASGDDTVHAEAVKYGIITATDGKCGYATAAAKAYASLKVTALRTAGVDKTVINPLPAGQAVANAVSSVPGIVWAIFLVIGAVVAVKVVKKL